MDNEIIIRIPTQRKLICFQFITKFKSNKDLHKILKTFCFSYLRIMITWSDLRKFPLDEKVQLLYEHATFVMAIRYYGYKVNLFLLAVVYLEVFFIHKKQRFVKIDLLDPNNLRLKFISYEFKLLVNS